MAAAGKSTKTSKKKNTAASGEAAEALDPSIRFKTTTRLPIDIEAPALPEGFEQKALLAGGYPYDKELKKKHYEEELEALQLELVKLQSHIRRAGERLVVVFEGRDTAGKGGCISRFMQHLNPRHARAVALSKPTEAERGQWYFQRYVPHLPTAGDIVLFDRSWYNRAGVERVMGFCTKEQLADFLRDAPEFESLLVQDGLRLVKVFLTIGRETQLLRFHERRHDPLKQWKVSEIDIAAVDNWDAYTEAQHDMFRFTHTPTAPWTVVRANDQRRARLEVIRHVLNLCSYPGKNQQIVHAPDPKIVGADESFFFSR